MTASPFRFHLRSAFWIVTFLFWAGSAVSQSLEWANNIGSVNQDGGRDICTDEEGNVYITGFFAGTMDFDPGPGVTNRTPTGSYDIYLAKYSPTGTLVWLDIIGGPFADESYKLTYADGYVYLAGYYLGAVDFDPGPGVFMLPGSGGEDAGIGKYRASDGTLVWARSIGGSGMEHATSVAVDGQGNVYVGGEFTGTPDFDPGAGTYNLTTFGQSDGFVEKLDSNGIFQWAGQLGGTFFDYFHELDVDTAGAVYVTGSFGLTADMDLMAGTFNLVSAGGQDIYFCKYSKHGALVWAQRLGNTGNDEGQGLDLGLGMHLGLTGYFQGTVDFNGFAGTNNVSSRGGSIDVFVARYDTAGNNIWALPVGDGADDKGNSIAVTPAGVFYSTGYIFGTADFDPGPATRNVTADFRDPFVARYDVAGNYSWAFVIYGGNDDRGNGIAVDPLGKILVMGHFRGISDFDPGAGSFSLTTVGNDDPFFAKYLPCQEPSATSHPSAASTCVGGGTAFSFAFSGPADSTRWYSSTDEGATWLRLADGGTYAGAATTTLNIAGASAALNSTWYRAVLYSCIGAADTTDAAPLYVTIPSAAFSPLPQDACEDAETVTFTPHQYSLQFDASLDYLQSSLPVTGNFGTGAFTLEAWIKTTASGAPLYLLTKGVTGACNSSWSLGLNAAGKVTFDLADAGCINTASVVGATSVNTGSWRHIAVTRSGTTVSIFVDGVADGIATSAVTLLLSNADPIVVGSSSQAIGLSDASSGYQGGMDDIRIWDYAKSASEIALLRRRPMQGDEDYLHAAWPLDEGPASALAVDATAGGCNLSLVGFNLSSDWIWNNIHQLSFSWNFGDAATSSDSIAQHVYATSNTFLSSLLTTTPAGCQASDNEPVFVVQGPSASWTATSMDTCIGDTIQFYPDQFGLRFDGVNEYASAVPAFSPAGDFTFEAWTKWEGSTGNDQVVFYNGDISGNGYGLVINTAGFIALRVFGSADAASSYSPPLNAWVHLALVRSGSNWSLLVNGSAVSLSGSPAISSATGIFSIAGNTDPTKFFKGTIDEVRFWSEARSTQQVLAYMRRSLKGTEINLLATYNMDFDRPSSTVNNQVAAGPDLALANMEPATDFVWSNPLGQTWEWFVDGVSESTDSLFNWAPPASGVYEVKLTTLNTRGCIASDSANVVGDTVRPLSVCQNINLYLDGAGVASITPADLNDGTSDGCGIDSLWLSEYSFSCVDTGSIPVRLIARDNALLLDSCIALVTLSDTLNPVEACKNLTVHLSAVGTATITPAMVDDGSTDNCGIASRALSRSTFSCADVGGNNITLTLRDVSGNRDSCTSIVTVIDTVKPTAVCRNITLQLNAAGSATLLPSMLDNGSADACGLSALGVSQSVFGCAHVGANVITLTVPDVNGNSSSCTGTVTVQDTVKPIALCQNLTRYLDASGNASITAISLDNGSSDACGIASRSASQLAFSCAHVGSNNVTLTVIDVNGNPRSCLSTVTILDTVKANALCRNVSIWLDSAGIALTAAGAVNNGSNDACGIASLALSQTSFGCADLGANAVTLSVTDVNGNLSTCNATVTVSDTIDIRAVCRNRVLHLNASGAATLSPAQVDSASWDNCGIALFTLSETNFTCADVGANPVTLMVEDPFGNDVSCGATVTVVDSTAPLVSCNNLTVFLDGGGSATVSPAAVLASGTDNCGLLPATLSRTSFGCADAGANIDTLFLGDVNGNLAYCLSTITVLENVAPVAACKDVTVYLDSTGVVVVPGSLVDNGSSDNCGITGIALTPSTFGCADLGANLTQVVVSDGSTNRDTCFSTITVSDTINVRASCRNLNVYLNAAGTATIDSSMVNNGSYDNCTLVTMALSKSSFTCADVGMNPVTLTVTNENGASDACVSTVTVSDTLDANALCRNLTLYLSAAGSASITAPMLDNGSTDNCGIASRVLSTSSFTCAQVGPNNVTLTFTDVNGNVSSCISVVTVVDSVKPIALCRPVSLFLNAAGSATLLPSQVDNGSSDACGLGTLTLSSSAFGCANVGVNVVTLTVPDVNGNQRTCTSNVTVSDTTDAIVSCLDTVVYLGAAGTVTIDTSYVVASLWDNCGIASINLSQSTFSCADVEYLFIENADQSQTGHNDYSAEDRYWQSFTTGLTGDLTRLRILDSSATTLSLRIFSGVGTAGTLLGTQTFTSGSGWANVVLTPGLPVTAGGTYTFEVERITAASEPVYSTLNPYAGGAANLNGYTGVSNNLDIAFETFVTMGTLFPDVPITVTVQDASGNSGTCLATVTVLDTLLPAVSCASATLYLDASGDASANAFLIGASSADNCGIDTMWLSQTEFTCAHLGANAPTLFVRDNEGNVTTCVASITVLDTLDPVAVCSPVTAYLDASGMLLVSPSLVDGGSSDNCSVSSSAVLPAAFDCTDLGAQAVTLTVSDGSGNSSSCVALVTVSDTLEPSVASCPLPIIVTADSADCTPAVSWTLPTFADNCSYSVSASHSPGDAFPVGVTTVMYTATDTAGLTGTCSFTVTVDAQPLVVDMLSSDAGFGYEVSCFGESDGWLKAQPRGGCLPYSYEWSTGSLVDSIGGLAAGSYTVTVTDGRGISDTLAYLVSEPPQITLVVDSILHETCPGLGNGGIELTTTGGVPLYALLWSDGFVGEDRVLLSAGIYSVTVTDAMGCVVVDTFTVPGDSLIPVAAFSYDSTATPTWVFTDLSTGGVSSWNWSFGDGDTSALQNPTHTYGAIGSYTVTLIVTSPCGSDTASQTIFVDTLTQVGGVMAPAVHVSPNPTQGEFLVEIRGWSQGTASLSLTDLHGRILMEEEVKLKHGSTSYRGSLSQFPQGVYLLQVSDGERKVIVRLVRM